MTEVEYINVCNKAKFRAAQAVLNHVMPEYSGISKRDYARLHNLLQKFIEAADERIKITKEPA
jgi:hypothetical protein